MTRIARFIVPGLPHHISARGNYGQDVFLEDRDRELYLDWIEEYSRIFGVSFLGNCLMSNHVHFVGIPENESALAKTFDATNGRYSRHLNKKVGVKGHLWQGRFYSCVLDESHLIAAVRYVERNPVRAGIVKKPWEWKWSSASAHIGMKRDYRFNSEDFFGIINMNMSFESWRQFIDSKENEKFINNIRKNTFAGRPLGSIAFVKDLEKRFGRKLIANPKGRPRKVKLEGE